MTESYFKRLRALTPKALCTRSTAFGSIFNLVFFFSQSKRDYVSILHPFCISVCADDKHESFFLHLMTYKAISLTGQPLVWGAQESSQTVTSWFYTQVFSLVSNKLVFHLSRILPWMVLIFHMSIILVLLDVHNHPFSPLKRKMKGIRFLHSNELCQMERVIIYFQNLKYGLVLTTMVSWIIGQGTPIRGCHLAHEPVYLPEGHHSFGHISTSEQKRPTTLLWKSDTACVTLCITEQVSTAMMNLTDKVFPTFLVRSSSVVALYITCASFLKFPQGKRKKKKKRTSYTYLEAEYKALFLKAYVKCSSAMSEKETVTK